MLPKIAVVQMVCMVFTFIQTEGPIEEVAAAGRTIEADVIVAKEAEVVAAHTTGLDFSTHSEDVFEIFLQK